MTYPSRTYDVRTYTIYCMYSVKETRETYLNLLVPRVTGKDIGRAAFGWFSLSEKNKSYYNPTQLTCSPIIKANCPDNDVWSLKCVGTV
jgi:hypothetical protein